MRDLLLERAADTDTDTDTDIDIDNPRAPQRHNACKSDTRSGFAHALRRLPLTRSS
jgi:hypothetical protein